MEVDSAQSMVAVVTAENGLYLNRTFSKFFIFLQQFEVL
jgi:hypothetical protein